MEDKRACPRCGHGLHDKSYLMARGAELVPGWRWMLLALLFVWLLGAFALAANV